MRKKYMGLGGCILIFIILGVIILFSGKKPEHSATQKEQESEQIEDASTELNDEVITVESDDGQTEQGTKTSVETATVPKDEEVDKPSEDMADEEWTKDYKIEY